MVRFSDNGGAYSFSYPESWIVEPVPDMNGVVLIAPDEEANWLANMFFEIVIDSKNRGLTRFVAETIPHIRERKKTSACFDRMRPNFQRGLGRESSSTPISLMRSS